MSDFRLNLEFANVPGHRLVFPADVTEAEVSIYAGDDCLTLNREPGRSKLVASTSEMVIGKVAGLADWFIENWEPILWETQTPFAKTHGLDTTGNVDSGPVSKLIEMADRWSEFPEFEYLLEEMENDSERQLVARADWDHRHLLGHASSRLALPRIWIIPEDQSVVLVVDGLPQQAGASVVFLSPEKRPRRLTFRAVSRAAFCGAVEQFVAATIERANSNPKFARWANWLAERWTQAQAQAKDEKRKLVWQLGAVSAERIRELSHSRPDIAHSMEQMLLDCPIVRDKSQLSPIESLIGEYLLKGMKSKVPDNQLSWQGLGRTAIKSDEPDYQQGYELARLARKRLNLEDRPVRDPTEVLDRFGVNLGQGSDSPLFRVAICASKNAQAHIVPSSADARMNTIPGFRFGVFSGLGRLLWEGRRTTKRPICSAQGDYSMISQSRRANAFAAEFLLPREVIQGLNPHSQEFLDQVESYGISRRAAAWHLHNVSSGEYGR